MKQIIILILPGWKDSEPEYWQGIWLKKYPNALKVRQDNWMFPEKSAWVKTINDYIEHYKENNIIFVGHSLACATFVYWSEMYSADTSASIKGTLLVSPSDMDVVDFPKEVNGFPPMPLEPLNCKTIVAASENDPFVSMDRAKYFAHSWKARLINIGPHGHINVEAGFGEWPEGEGILRELME